jgi:signal transduction histidine kinase/ActR/RegA family two-component response regulator
VELLHGDRTAVSRVEMNAATLLTLTACAIEVVMGSLALAFAGAQGWRHFRTFAMIAFSAAAYSSDNALFASVDPHPALVVWASRLNLALACVQCSAWIVYVRRQYGEPLGTRDRAFIYALALIGLIGLLPNWVMCEPIVQQTIAWAGVTYHVATLTWLGALFVFLVPLFLAAPALTYLRKARQGVPGARVHVVAFFIMFLTMLNESLVGAGVLDNLYLIDLGFLAAVLSVCGEMTYRVTRDAQRLEHLSDTLARQVEERTRELMQTRDNLVRSERLAGLGRLSASIGHEINNPLSYVIGNLSYVCDELADDQSVRQDALIESAVRDALGGAERIRKIVSELRAFNLSTEREARRAVDVEEALESATKLARTEIRHRARLVRDCQVVPKVMADATKLTQVFVNVLVNAAQAIPEERMARGKAVISLKTRTLPGDRVLIEISDTGTGMQDEVRQRLFEPFFTTKPGDRGTGLGLFVSLGIVTGFGGTIEVNSRLDEGTTIRIILPAWQGLEPVPETGPRISLRALKNRRLLVVDDDVLVARTLARQLSGHQVEVVSSGQAALDRLGLDGQSFDLVLCDLMMPDMTGMEVYETVEERYPALAERFVFISGGGVTERSRQFLETHADRVLPKPIDSRQLCELLLRTTTHEQSAHDDKTNVA